MGLLRLHTYPQHSPPHTPFDSLQVNADVKRYILEGGVPRLVKVDTNSVGRTISTKAVGTTHREDITDQVGGAPWPSGGWGSMALKALCACMELQSCSFACWLVCLLVSGLVPLLRAMFLFAFVHSFTPSPHFIRIQCMHTHTHT